MKIQDAVKKLNELEAKKIAYGHAIAMLHFDGSTIAPPNSFEGRSKTISFLAGEVYKNFINKKTDELLNFLLDNKDKLDKITLVKTKENREEYDRTSKIPIGEYMEYMKLQNKANFIWEKAKKENDYSSFQPYLTKIISMNKKFANYRNPEKPAYDVMLGDYEKGYTMEDYDLFFKTLKERLIPLIREAVPRAQSIKDDFLYKDFPIYKQKLLIEKIVDFLKLDRDSFIIAQSEHPFTMGINKKDVRFTNHYYENNFTSAFFSALHEGGHALYELNTGDDLIYTSLGTGTSLGMHESQSRFYENIVGRSREFINHFYPLIKQMFPQQFSDVTKDVFYMAINKPQNTLIRIEADELTYSLHIIIRYEIEKLLFAGDVKSNDIPGLWNKKYKEYLGITPPDNTRGVLQDVHWSQGMLGYFPTYALGSAVASQLAVAMAKNFDYKADIASGDLTKVNKWLNDKVHKHGALLKPKEVIQYACGEAFNANYYCDYLINKYSE